jgi:UDP-glucuronate decarboxylase
MNKLQSLFHNNLIKNNDWLLLLNNKTLLITGYSGMVGSLILNVINTASTVLNIKLNLILVSRQKKNIYEHENITYKYIEEDIRNLNKNHLNFNNINYVIHGATPVKENVQDYEMIDICYSGTANLLNLLNYDSLIKLLLLSSGAVYGDTGNYRNKLISENSKSSFYFNKSTDSYALGKISSEAIIKYYFNKNNSNYSIARIFAMIGPEIMTGNHYAISSFINNINNSEGIVIKSDGKDYRSYLNTFEAGIWLLKILCMDKKNSIYNVGSSRPISILQLAMLIKTISGHSTDIQVIGQRDNLERSWYVPSNEKIISDLGVVEHVTLEQSILELLNA